MSLETAKQYRQLAKFYRGFGFNVLPLDNEKAPAITGVAESGKPFRFQWEAWQVARQTDAIWGEIQSKKYWIDVAGIGAITGGVSGDLVCLDFDSEQPLEVVERFVNATGLPSDYNWVVRSPRGWHVWLRCPRLELPDGKGKMVRPGSAGGLTEIRWTGHQTALPGSLHPTGKYYEWHNGQPVDAPAMVEPDVLMSAYLSVTVEPEPEAPKVTAPTQKTTVGANIHDAYARKALEDECAKLRNTVSGGRNDQTNKSAFSLAQLIGAGVLTEAEVENGLLDAAIATGLSENEARIAIRSGLRDGVKLPRVIPASNGYHADTTVSVYEWGFTLEMPDPLDLDALPAKHHTWPYAIEDGRMVYLRETKDDVVSSPIADFTCAIAEEIVSEDGDVRFVLAGDGLRCGAFRTEISGLDFGSDARLLSVLSAATGGIDPVYNRMNGHLRPAIGMLTQTDKRPRRVRYYRVGWQDDTYSAFLMPGMDDTTLIVLPRQIAYHAPLEDADSNMGFAALRSLIEAMDLKITTPIIAALLAAPLMRPAGLHNERFGVFIAGRTGSLKTSWTQTAMCLYGPEFIKNDNLLKMGEGATRTAIMGFATCAHDMPLFVDNFKPNTGNGKQDFVNLIHNLIEGSDRKRSDRTGALRDAKLTRCVPVITGEDMPTDDAASVARVLRVTFAWQNGEANEKLTFAQQNSAHLSTIGYAWIQWIAGEGKAIIRTAAEMFPDERTRWAKKLQGIKTNSANIARIASNLAINSIAWQIALQHPTIGRVLSDYDAAHAESLDEIAKVMATSTTEAMEAYQYRNALRELVGSGQYLLVHRTVGVPADRDRDRLLGWQDDDGIYLLPNVALAAVKRLLGQSALLVSPQTLYNQFEQLGWIAKKGDGHTARLVSIGGEKKRVLHLVPSFVIDEEPPIEDEDVNVLGL